MRVKVRVKGTCYRNANGTLAGPLESPEELAELSAQAQARHDDQQVRRALEHYTQHRDLEPLRVLLLEANPGILRSRDAIELLAGATRGEIRKGRGRFKTMEAVERDRRICAAAHWLKVAGMPLKNSPDRNKSGAAQQVSACRLIGERLCISEDAVYSVARAASYEPSCFELLPWRLLGELPTPERVMRHYLPTDAEAHPRSIIGPLYCEFRPSILRAVRRALGARSLPNID